MSALVVDGRHVALLDRGEGSPVVLVHASGLGAAQWGPVAPRLAEAWRVLAPDLLGCGGTDPWPDPDHYALAADIAVVRAVAEHAGAPVHLVGHSYGGLLALRLATEAPALVRSLAVYEPVAFGVLDAHDPEGAASLRDALDPTFFDPATGGDEAWLQRFVDFWNGPGAWVALSERTRAALLASGRKSFLEVRALVDEAWPVERFDVRVPTLIMSGTRSPRAARGVCRVLAETLPAARLEVFDGAGHMAPIAEAKRFVRALEGHLSGV